MYAAVDDKHVPAAQHGLGSPIARYLWKISAYDD